MLCLSKYFLLLSRALQLRQSTVLRQSCGCWAVGCGLPTHSKYWPNVQTSPEVSVDRNLQADWELPKAAILNFYRLITSLLCSNSWTSHLHSHTCPIPVHLKDQATSGLWWPLGSNAVQIKPWGQLCVSPSLSAWVIETHFNCFLHHALE